MVMLGLTDSPDERRWWEQATDRMISYLGADKVCNSGILHFDMDFWDNDSDTNFDLFEELDNIYDKWDDERFNSLNRTQDDHDSLFDSTDSDNDGSAKNEDDNDLEKIGQLSCRESNPKKRMRIAKKGDEKTNDIKKVMAIMF